MYARPLVVNRPRCVLFNAAAAQCGNGNALHLARRCDAQLALHGEESACRFEFHTQANEKAAADQRAFVDSAARLM